MTPDEMDDSIALNHNDDVDTTQPEHTSTNVSLNLDSTEEIEFNQSQLRREETDRDAKSTFGYGMAFEKGNGKLTIMLRLYALY